MILNENLFEDENLSEAKKEFVAVGPQLPRNWVIVRHNGRYALLKQSEFDKAKEDPDKWFNNISISTFPTKKELIKQFKREPFYSSIFDGIGDEYMNEYLQYDSKRDEDEEVFDDTELLAEIDKKADKDAMDDINRHEAEFGADGWRAFGNFNSEEEFRKDVLKEDDKINEGIQKKVIIAVPTFKADEVVSFIEDSKLSIVDRQDDDNLNYSTFTVSGDAIADEEEFKKFDDLVKDINIHYQAGKTTTKWVTEDMTLPAVSAEEIAVTEENPSKEVEDNAYSNAIIDALNDEWATVQKYQDIVNQLSEHEDFKKFIPVIDDIIKDEKNHVGNLQKILDEINPKTIPDIKDGEQEATDQMTGEETEVEKNENN